MAGGGGAHREHDAFDKQFFAGLLVVLGLAVAGVAFIHRLHLSHSSQPGDACPVTASGGLVGFDAETGAVRWTNVVPPAGLLTVDDETGAPVLVTDESKLTDQNLVIERTIDPSTGRIAACERSDAPDLPSEYRRVSEDNPFADPVQIGDITVANWGDGLRATDPTNTGIWSVEASWARARVGDDAIVATSDQNRPGTARLDLATGEPRWTSEQRYLAMADDSRLVLTTDPADIESVTALDAATGDEVWSTHLPWPDPNREPWALSGRDLGPLTLFPTGEGGRVLALDSKTGEIVWQGTGGSPGRNWKYSEPGSVGSAVLSPDGDTIIASIDAWIPDQYD